MSAFQYHENNMVWCPQGPLRTGLWELFWLCSKLAQIIVHLENFVVVVSFSTLPFFFYSFLTISYNSSLLLVCLELPFNLLLQVGF